MFKGRQTPGLHDQAHVCRVVGAVQIGVIKRTVFPGLGMRRTDPPARHLVTAD